MLADKFRLRAGEPLLNSVATAIQHSPHPASLMELIDGELVFRTISYSLFHATSILLRSDTDHRVFPRLGEEITEIQLGLIDAGIWEGEVACGIEIGTAVRDQISQPVISTHTPITLADGRRFLRVDTRMLSIDEHDDLRATRPPLELLLVTEDF
jgi:hypothetical protein